MIRESILKLVDSIDLSEDEAYNAMTNIMTGKTTDTLIASFLTALRMKGETTDEIYAFAKTMRDFSVRINAPQHAIDTCGTGGDDKNTFNISTAAAFVIAGAGIPIAKHGNRSVSSKCGSADILDELGVSISLTPYAVEKCLEDVGIGFLFAPVFHKAMKYAIGPRRDLGMRTVFNLLGPLTNPANVDYQLVGVFDPELTLTFAKVLQRLGLKHALVVHGSGLDEITTTGETKITELKDDKIINYYVEPEQFGIPKTRLSDIQGGSPKRNASILDDVLEGKETPYLDVVLLNAAAGLYTADSVSSITEGIELARDSVLEGKAWRKLESLRNLTQELSSDNI